MEILGTPGVSGDRDESWGPRNEINIGYGEGGCVNHVGFSPGAFELRLRNEVIWTTQSHDDPNPKLLVIDCEPKESLGFLVFRMIGLTTTGYHDDDPSQYAITVFPRGAWDRLLGKATAPDLSKYRQQTPQ